MQAVDSARLSLESFRQRAGFSSEIRSSTCTRKSTESALKTVFWFYGLCRLERATGAYELERAFDREERWKRPDGSRRQSNKWPGYSKGRHEPRQVLAAVQAKHRHANDCLRSPLWPALAADPLSLGDVQDLLAGLPRSMQVLVCRHHFWPGSETRPRTANSRMLAGALERRASLDALAAVILLLRSTKAAGDEVAAYEWGRRIWRMMVLLGPDLVRSGIARPLAEFIEERAMPMATLQGIRMGFPEGGYMRVVEAFAKARADFSLMWLSIDATELQRMAIGPQLLDGKLGWDCRYAFNPIPILDDNVDRLGVSGHAVREARWAEEERHCHEWGLNMRTIGGHPSLPPFSACRGEDLWAEDPEDRFALRRAQRRTQGIGS